MGAAKRRRDLAVQAHSLNRLQGPQLRQALRAIAAKLGPNAPRAIYGVGLPPAPVLGPSTRVSFVQIGDTPARKPMLLRA